MWSLQSISSNNRRSGKRVQWKVFVGKLDVDENPLTAERFGIFSIPTMIVYKNGKEVERLVGLCPKKNIDALLTKHLG